MNVRQLIQILTEFPMNTKVVIDIDELRLINTRDIRNIYQTIRADTEEPVIIIDGDWGNVIPETPIIKHFKIKD